MPGDIVSTALGSQLLVKPKYPELVHSLVATFFRASYTARATVGLQAMTTPRPRECEPSRYRHGCDPPRTTHVVYSSDCTSLDIIRPPRAATSLASTQSLIRLVQLPHALALSLLISSKARK